MSPFLAVSASGKVSNGSRVYSRRPKKIQADVVGSDNDSTPASSSQTKPFPERKKKSLGGKEEQMVLDLGQAIQVNCKYCGMTYDRSDPQDVSTHEKHHSRLTKGIEWTGKQIQRHARVLSELRLRKASNSGRKEDEIEVAILAYDWGKVKMDTATMMKLDQVRKDMDQALGAAPMPSSIQSTTKMILAVSNGRVIGSLIAGSTPKGKARRVEVESIGATDGAVFVP